MADVELPYLPDILNGVVTRVHTKFSTRDTDPFNVHFDFGIYAEVARAVYKKDNAGTETFPLVFLLMNYPEQRGVRYDLFGTVTCDIIIAMPTNHEYTMAQRTANVFKPRLLPIYQELLVQIAREKKLDNPYVNKIEHTKIDRPFWGINDANSPDTKNMFGNFIEAVQLKDLKLNISHNC